MKFMPPKLNYYTGISSTNHGGLVLSSIFPSEAQRLFDRWYAKEIAPLFENAVVVFNNENSRWREREFLGDTHTALLIKIEPLPVKEESAEDLLREMVEIFDTLVISSDSIAMGMAQQQRTATIFKAKAYLEKHNKET